jgi:hypothetical protein
LIDALVGAGADRTEYSPEAVPAKTHRDLSSIYYWKHAAGKRSPPVPRKPDVLKELEKEGSATGPKRVGGLEDITEMVITRPPGVPSCFLAAIAWLGLAHPTPRHSHVCSLPYGVA